MIIYSDFPIAVLEHHYTGNPIRLSQLFSVNKVTPDKLMRSS